MSWDSCVQNGIATLKCLPVAFNNVINAALLLSGVVAVILIILSGIKFISSGGDPVKVEGAKKTMTYAIIGLVIIVMAFFLLKVLSTITGVDCKTLGVQC
jgi:hypothetical protein